MFKLIANGLLFQLGWFACVLGGDWVGLIAAGVVLGLHFIFIAPSVEESYLVAAIVIVGFAFDTLLIQLGILQVPEGITVQPLWLLSIWLIFSTTLRHALAWLQGRYVLAGVLGAITGTASYLGGANLSDSGVMIAIDEKLLVLALLWAATMPLLYVISEKTEIIKDDAIKPKDHDLCERANDA